MSGLLTPVERHDGPGGGLWLKREDLLEVASGHRGAKARTCYALAMEAKAAGRTLLITAGSRHSPQVAMVAAIALRLGMACRVHVPTGPDTPETLQAAAAGAEVVRHRAGYNTVIVARAAADLAGSMETGALIPFGMECQLAVLFAALQVRNVPEGVARVVVPVGSGMTLAGVARGLQDTGRKIPILGVTVGADPRRRLNRWAPPWWEQHVELVPADQPYERHFDTTWPPWLGDVGVPLDPVYEAKVVPWLRPNDLFWIVGHRA